MVIERDFVRGGRMIGASVVAIVIFLMRREESDGDAMILKCEVPIRKPASDTRKGRTMVI